MENASTLQIATFLNQRFAAAIILLTLMAGVVTVVDIDEPFLAFRWGEAVVLLGIACSALILSIALVIGGSWGILSGRSSRWRMIGSVWAALLFGAVKETPIAYVRDALAGQSWKPQTFDPFFQAAQISFIVLLALPPTALVLSSVVRRARRPTQL